MGKKKDIKVGQVINGYEILQFLGIDACKSFVYRVKCKHCGSTERRMRTYAMNHDMSSSCKCSLNRKDKKTAKIITCNYTILDNAIKDYGELGEDIEFRRAYKNNCLYNLKYIDYKNYDLDSANKKVERYLKCINKKPKHNSSIKFNEYIKMIEREWKNA